MAVRLALAVIGAVVAKVLTALTVRVWLPLAPSTTLPVAVTNPLAVMGAVEAKVVTALTVRVWLAVVPSTVLPAAVRVLLLLLRVTPTQQSRSSLLTGYTSCLLRSVSKQTKTHWTATAYMQRLPSYVCSDCSLLWFLFQIKTDLQ